MPVPAAVGPRCSLLMATVTLDGPPAPVPSAGVGGGGIGPSAAGIRAPVASRDLSVVVRRGDFHPGEEDGYDIVVSVVQQLSRREDTCDRKKKAYFNEGQSGNPNTSREITFPTGITKHGTDRPLRGNRHRLSDSTAAPQICRMKLRATRACTSR